MSAPAVAAPLAVSHQARAVGCTQNVEFGLLQATAAGCLDETSPGTWQTADRVELNGVPVTPASGTKLVLTAPSSVVSNPLAVVDKRLPIACETRCLNAVPPLLQLERMHALSLQSISRIRRCP